MGCVTMSPVSALDSQRADPRQQTTLDSVQGRGTRGGTSRMSLSLSIPGFSLALQLPSAFPFPPLQTGYYPREVHPLLPGP